MVGRRAICLLDPANIDLTQKLCGPKWAEKRTFVQNACFTHLSCCAAVRLICVAAPFRQTALHPLVASFSRIKMFVFMRIMYVSFFTHVLFICFAFSLYLALLYCFAPLFARFASFFTISDRLFEFFFFCQCAFSFFNIAVDIQTPTSLPVTSDTLRKHFPNSAYSVTKKYYSILFDFLLITY